MVRGDQPRTLPRTPQPATVASMLDLAVKAGVSGVLIAAASELAKRYPGFGALIASLPLVSILGMIWLWRDKPDAANMSAHVGATFWFVLPSLPMFLAIPAMLDRGMPFWAALTLGCALTIALYGAMVCWGRRSACGCSAQIGGAERFQDIVTATLHNASGSAGTRKSRERAFDCPSNG